jgi:hypothetical protein
MVGWHDEVGWHCDGRAVVQVRVLRLVLVSPLFSIGVPLVVCVVAVLKGGACGAWGSPRSDWVRPLRIVPALLLFCVAMSVAGGGGSVVVCGGVLSTIAQCCACGVCYEWRWCVGVVGLVPLFSSVFVFAVTVLLV